MKWCQLIILPILAVTLAGILALMVALSPPSPPEMKEAPTLPAPKQHLLDNVWNVEYKGVRRPDQSMKQVLCQLKTRARLRTVDGSEEPFSSLGWARLVPPLPLEQLHRRQEDQGSFKTCAVVASSGAILHSGLGKEIDSHDVVMRFNDAPTEGYEEDVGSRTTIRLVNAMVLTQPAFKFNTSSLYRNVTLVAWESAPYDLNLNEWYAVGRLFGPYKERRTLDPGQPFYALHPSFFWQLWDVVQGNTRADISPRPPTSGFMGILVMMALCDEVHAYEYIPSPRQTSLCHYYDKSVYDITCTLGGRNEWHPVQFEKRLIRRINIGDEGDLGRGVVTLPGFSTINNCEI